MKKNKFISLEFAEDDFSELIILRIGVLGLKGKPIISHVIKGKTKEKLAIKAKEALRKILLSADMIRKGGGL